MEAYKRQAVEVEFSDATAGFENLRDFMGSTDALHLEHSAIERELNVRGREVLRLLLQDHLSLRAQLETPVPVTGSDGVTRTYMRPADRALMTIFGPVRVWRVGVRGREHGNLFPLDAELNLPQEEHSHGVRERVAVETAKGSFEEAVAAVRSTTGAVVSKRQTEKLTALAAQDFELFYAERPTEELLALKDEIVVVTTDAKGIVVRHKDLREGTRRAAEKSGHKLEKRLSKGEKRNRKRMSTVAAVYSVLPHVRTPDDVLGELRPVGDVRAPRPKPQHKRVFASVVKETAEVVTEMFEEASRRDPELQRKWTAVVDGNETQFALLEKEAKERKIPLVIVLDLIHGLEYLWKAAYCFHSDGTKEAEAWVTERLRALLEGKVSDVAAGIRRSATLRGLTAKARKPADTCANYFLKNKQYMRYHQYLADGLPIASGVIEGACRHLVKDRMDITGARWSLLGAEAVLRLRALRSSRDFDEYWPFHLLQEQVRNHDSLYTKTQHPPRVAPVLRLVRS